MKFKKRRGRLAGFEVPVVSGGLSWTPGTSERDVIRALVIDLEARRALYGDFDEEGEGFVGASIRWMRDRLSETLQDLVDGSEASRLITQLREACNEYLTTVPDADESRYLPLRPHARVALQKFRESFRVKLLYIGNGGLERATELAGRIPFEVSA